MMDHFLPFQSESEAITWKRCVSVGWQDQSGRVIVKGMWISFYFGNRKYVQIIGLQPAISASESPDEHSVIFDRKRLVRGREFLLKNRILCDF